MELQEIHEEIQHEHPLVLEDLQSMYVGYEEDDDDFDDNDLIATQNFKRTCDMCGFGIDWYHRYYYKCSESSCNYSLHKFCAKRPTTFRFPAHPIHDLHLKKGSDSWSCHACFTKHQHGICYHCSTCNYEIDLGCVTFVDQTTIHHPGHPHTLISPTVDASLSKCFACGKKHEGVFYHCITCFNFSINVNCVTLPFKFSLQNLHTHMLTLSLSFLVLPEHSKCRICRMNISDKLWMYKCSKCRYYVHLDCATSRGEPFMSIFSRGMGKTYSNFEVVDYPDLLHYPLDEFYNILPHQILRAKDHQNFDQVRYDGEFYTHSSHEHPLRLINTTNTSTLGIQPVSLHDPIKRIKLLCNGCVRPITTTPFYMCEQLARTCDFYLHEWCTRLPIELENHPSHRKHTLKLLYHLPRELGYAGFECNICRLRCNGFAYACSTCDYRADVNCGLIPETITHEAHPNHLLSITDPSSIQSRSTRIACDACDVIINTSEICYKCISCDFYLDNRCALHLPKTITHKYDKHPLKLSYSPIESHKSQYFCEVCEEDLDPEMWFYHCSECSQSIHSACAPLILKSEQGVNPIREEGVQSIHMEGVYMFLNMKFGRSLRLVQEAHLFAFHAGTKSDGCCNICNREMQSTLIFKCLECDHAYHVSCAEEVVTWSDYSDSELEAFLRRLPKLEKKIEHQTTDIPLPFYPSGVTRPVTGHWKAVNERVIEHL